MEPCRPPAERRADGDQRCKSDFRKIGYKRPETWAFWFSARILSHTVQVEGKSVSVLFDIVPGVGRASFDTKVPSPGPGLIVPAFCSMRWVIPPGASIGPRERKYCTQVRGPVLDETEDNDNILGFFIDRIPAQDIQVMATLVVDSFDNAGVNRLSVEAQAFFSPLSHVRPDWFVENFAGEEVGGT